MMQYFGNTRSFKRSLAFWSLAWLFILNPMFGQSSSVSTESTGPENYGISRAEELVKAALERTQVEITYDGAYRRIDYPGGDVPPNIGVCTDVVIRSYRRLGVDLQQLVHEDMQADFSAYPRNWGLSKPDSNIDHRRVPNLETFFKRHGTSLPLSRQEEDYFPGDLVSWRLPGNNLPHIGIVTHYRTADDSRPLIVHNIGRGPVLEDCLFSFDIVGHFRYDLEGPLEGDETSPPAVPAP